MGFSELRELDLIECYFSPTPCSHPASPNWAWTPQKTYRTTSVCWPNSAARGHLAHDGQSHRATSELREPLKTIHSCLDRLSTNGQFTDLYRVMLALRALCVIQSRLNEPLFFRVPDFTFAPCNAAKHDYPARHKTHLIPEIPAFWPVDFNCQAAPTAL
jgi:hypothetical protein